MSEIEKKEEDDQETEEDEVKAHNLVDKANLAAARLEAANQQLEKNLAKQEALQVEKTLGGEATIEPQKLEETPEEYKERVLKGELNDQKQ